MDGGVSNVKIEYRRNKFGDYLMSLCLDILSLSVYGMFRRGSLEDV